MATTLRSLLLGRPAQPSPEPVAVPLIQERIVYRPAPPPTVIKPQAVQGRHLADTARLFANREDMISTFALPPDATIVEVGVGLGGLSQFVLASISLRQFVAIDTFCLHELPEIWGQSTEEVFGKQNHREYYRAKFSDYAEQLVICEGDSAEQLASFPDNHFDMVYLDADHTYEGLQRDVQQAIVKVKQNGYIVFNDYTVLDHMGNPYGVVQSVNELLQTGNWLVCGFSLDPYMYCDIALRRS